MTEQQAQSVLASTVKYLKQIDGITANQFEQALKVLCPPAQASLHFEAEADREEQRSKILKALESGAKLNTELNEICLRFGARIWELRHDFGHKIKTKAMGAGLYLYTLERE